MPTIAGLKRRGVPPAAVREFVKRIGVAKANSVVDVGMLEFCIREHLNNIGAAAHGGAAAAEGRDRELSGRAGRGARGRSTIPTILQLGTRKISFGRELYIERDDFMENPPKKFFRLSPGNEVRLRYAYFVKCTGVIKNDAGEVVELRCTYDPATKGGNAPDGRKVKATMHWLSAAAIRVPAEIRVYNQLFANPSPNAANFAADLNPESLEILSDARIEPSVAAEQFERGDAVRAAGLFRARQGSRRRASRCSTAPSGCGTPLRRKSAERVRGTGCKRKPTISCPPSWRNGPSALGSSTQPTSASLYSQNAFFFGSNPTALPRPGRRRGLFQRPAALAFAERHASPR